MQTASQGAGTLAFNAALFQALDHANKFAPATSLLRR
jgi:hypothetical protein